MSRGSATGGDIEAYATPETFRAHVRAAERVLDPDASPTSPEAVDAVAAAVVEPVETASYLVLRVPSGALRDAVLRHAEELRAELVAEWEVPS